MKICGLVIPALVAGMACSTAAADTAIYECDVEKSAELDAIHLEGAGVMPKIGTAEDGGRIFAIEISSPKPLADCDSACRMKQTVREVPSNRPRKTGPELCESGGNEVLMHVYSASASEASRTHFHSEKDPGFLSLIGSFDEGDTLFFWQSGLDYPGCVDTRLTIRQGRCKRRE